MLTRLQALRDKCRALAKNGRSAVEEIRNDPALKKEIEEVYLHYLGRRVTGCSNCLWDALIELTYTLKKEQAKMKTDKFILKRGKILHDVVNQDSSLDATRDNMTEDLALYHLLTNPHAKQFFETLPGDVDKLVKEFGKKYEASKLAKTGAESTGNVEADAILSKAKADADKVLGDREAALLVREAKALELATAVLDHEKLLSTEGTPVEVGEAKYEEVLALARELVTVEPANANDGDGGEAEEGTEVKLNDGTIVTLREGVAYKADGTVAKRGTYETADGGKLIVANKGAARIEAPAGADNANDGDGGAAEE